MTTSKRKIYSTLLALSLGVTLTGCDILLDLVATPDPIASEQTTSVERNQASLANKSVEVLSQTKPSDGATHEDLKTVSGEYEITWENGSLARQLVFSIDNTDLPKQAEMGDFQLERYHPDTQTWLAEGFVLGWNKDASQIAYQVSPPEQGFQTQANGPYIYRIRVYFFSDAVKVRREGSRFEITYYPSSYGYAASVKKDADWAGSGQNQSARIPNFIEDLDQTLNSSYEALLKTQTSGGETLFKALKEPISVYVQDTGGSAGNSPLGGPARISNKKINSWADMQQVAAHELVHVLQGSLYPVSSWVGGFLDLAGFLDRWMIEATAQYYAATALNLSPQEKGAFYSDQGKYISKYLSSPIFTNHDDSFYALGDFMDWLSSQGNPHILADALSSGQDRDILALNASIKEAKTYSGVGPALAAYTQYLLTHPEYHGDFSKTVRSSMKAEAKKHFENTALGMNFKSNLTYVHFEQEFEPLSSSYLLSLPSGISDDSLLVIKPKEKNSHLVTRTYAGVGKTHADYTLNPPIDKGSTLFGTNTLTLPHFGKGQSHPGLEAMITNPDMTDSQTGAFEAYVLRPPKVKEIEDGKVTWGLGELGNIPLNLIKGYNLYVGTGNVRIKSEVPIQGGASEQSITHSGIKKIAPLLLTVVDQEGNEWPEVKKQAINIELKSMVFSDPSAAIAMMPINSSVTIQLSVTGFANPKLNWVVGPYGIPSAGPSGELVYTPVPGASSGSGVIQALDVNAHSVVFTATEAGPLFLTANVIGDPLAKYPIFLNIIPILEGDNQ